MQRVWSTYLDSNGQQIERSDSASPHLMDSSPRASVAGSAYSAAGSTRHILADMNNSSSSDYGGLLNPPAPPFSNNAFRSSRDNLSLSSAVSSSNNLSLSVNYIPTKFSSSPISPMGAGARNRKAKKSAVDNINVPKRGGGADAFRSGEARMPSKRLRWNKFKWILLVTNACLTMYSLTALVVCLLTWFDVWQHSSIIRIANRSELVLSTIAACLGILTTVVGWSGILLNNRSFLAVYTFFTWITFAFLLVPGYITYRRRAFNLEGKINSEWSRTFDASDRMLVQSELKCCGYFSPFVEATISQTCYSRSTLPGCKLPYLNFQRMVLKRWYTAVFSLVPLQIIIMVSGLLCSNHITYRFGKGLMPEAYRLNLGTMAVIMENYANQLAEQYGSDVAADILKRSQSNLNAAAGNSDGGPTNPYGNAGQTHGAMSPFHAKYDSLGQ